MRTSRTALGILAAGITALAIAATPALAATATGMGNNGTGTGTCTLTGQPATGQQGVAGSNAMGSRGPGMGGGMGTITAPMGTLTSTQKAELASMAEEEKVAHDLYVALGAKYPEVLQFANIASAETQHLTAVRTVMTRYGIADPTAGYAAGEFKSDAFQALYDGLLASATSTTTALAAGIAVEKADIADLKAAMTGLTAPDVLQVYGHLLRGSERHLVAFGG